MPIGNIPPFTINPTPASLPTINALTLQLGMSTASELFSKAFGLLQMAQGRKVVLKGKDGVWEINDFVNKQIQVKFNPK